jgi:predicted RNA methylase
MATPNGFDKFLRKTMLLNTKIEQRSLKAIEYFYQSLNRGQRLLQDRVIEIMNDVCGASASEGGWTWKEAYDLIEAAFVQFIKVQPEFEDWNHLQCLVPHQTARSEEMLELQQFSTPLEIANIAEIAAQLTGLDTVLEPSAGTGILAGFAARTTHKLILNELCPRRSNILGHLFPEIPIYGYNAEQINDYLALATNLQPSVVIMNPPFSSSPNMAKRNRQAVFMHLRSALDRLADGGRLVAIGPHWFNPEMCDSFSKYPAQLLLSAYISGAAYRYHATTMETRLLVFDKIENQEPVKSIKVPLSELLEIVRTLPKRQLLGDTQQIVEAVVRVQETKVISRISAKAFLERSIDTELVQLSLVPPPAVRPGRIDLIHLDGFSDGVLLIYEVAEVLLCSAEFEGIYEPYRSSVIHIPGAIEHPTPLVESIAMASVKMPIPTYQPLLPAQLLRQGILSHAQLEAIIYAGEAHSKELDADWFYDSAKKQIIRVGNGGTRYRQGVWIGDGTGVGKGREVSGIFVDNWMQGRRKGVWLSKNPSLLEDSRRDWQSLGGNPDQIVLINKYNQGETIQLTEGILFVPYGTLRVGAKQDKQSRLDQIINWLGEDFDGCICFDEAHMMGNAMGEVGDRGAKAASQQGLAGLELQNRLPKARITYVSATGASKVSNLAYATRLGLWQTKSFSFDSREEFIVAMENSGIAAMEVVVRDLKALGLYMSRALSYDGIAYETLLHKLTPEQEEIYAVYAKVFQVIHHNIDAALLETNAVSEGGKCRNSNSKSAARSAFEGTKQRFFNHLITAAKFPTIVKALEADLEAGYAPILQIIATDEALLGRRLAEIPSDQWNDLKLDFTPKESICDYLMNSFPTQLQEVFADEEGREYSQLVEDEFGNPVHSQAALAMRDKLIEDIALLPSVPGFLDQLIWHFGTEAVAEVTGRSKRVVRREGKYELETRSTSANIAETQAFQGDHKKILIFSAAGGTGRSYHADLKAQNQRLRRHYLVQSGWEAQNAVQSLGRSHRSNQSQPPVFILTTSDVKGEVRFTSTIASRLESLGALTRGQRQTGGQGVYDGEIGNLTSIYAKAALVDFYNQLYRTGTAGYSIGEFCELTGLNLLTREKGLRDDLPQINTFLNRLLALAINDQNLLFGVFESILKDRIDAAKASGQYEIGLERLVADGGFKVLSENVLATHDSGSSTILYEIEKLSNPKFTTTHYARSLHIDDSYSCYVNGDKIALASPWGYISKITGAMVENCEWATPIAWKKMKGTEIAKRGWTLVTDESKISFFDRWEEEVLAAPKYISSTLYLVCGLLLPVWGKLPRDQSKVNRLTTKDGRVLLGRAVSSRELQKIYDKFDINRPKLSAEEIYEEVWDNNQTINVGKFRLARSYWKGNNYLEVLDASGRPVMEYLKSIGCKTEMIKFTIRTYIPVDENVREVILKLGS